MTYTTTTTGAVLEIGRRKRWSRVVLDHWTARSDPAPWAEAVAAEVVLLAAQRCYNGGRRRACTYGASPMIWHTVARREDEPAVIAALLGLAQSDPRAAITYLTEHGRVTGSLNVTELVRRRAGTDTGVSR